MAKGSYRGGSTLVGPRSGWFTFGPDEIYPDPVETDDSAILIAQAKRELASEIEALERKPQDPPEIPMSERSNISKSARKRLGRK